VQAHNIQFRYLLYFVHFPEHVFLLHPSTEMESSLLFVSSTSFCEDSTSAADGLTAGGVGISVEEGHH